MLVGVNLSHDYAYATLENGEIRLFEYERRSRIRYHWNESSYTLAVLDDLTLEELDAVQAIYFSCPRLNQLVRRSGDLSTPTRTYTYVGTYPDPSANGAVGRGEILVSDLRIPAACVSHYHAHAAAAFWPSPFTDADVFCLDGGGDFGEGAFFHATRGGLELQKRFLDVQLGSSYHHFALRVFGEKRGFFESKVMAMAAFGEARLCEDSYLSSRGRLNHIAPEISPSVHDIADFQEQFTDKVLQLLDGAPRRSPNVACAGGCFYNVLTNLSIAESGLYEQVFIPPHVGDMGTALGCALLAALDHEVPLPDPTSLSSPFLGDEFVVTATGLMELIEQAGDLAIFHDVDTVY